MFDPAPLPPPADPSGPSYGDRPPGPTSPTSPPARRVPARHPARGARRIALLASVSTMLAVAGAMAESEGAFDADPTDASTGAGSGAVAADPATGGADTAAGASPDPGSEGAEISEPEAGSATSSTIDGTFPGTVEFTRWGDVQVEVTVSDGEIVDIVPVELPSGGRSSAINAQAEPLLEAQAIATQGADIDIVSGATYTSLAYADSLQAALDQAAVESGESVVGRSDG